MISPRSRRPPLCSLLSLSTSIRFLAISHTRPRRWELQPRHAKFTWTLIPAPRSSVSCANRTVVSPPAGNSTTPRSATSTASPQGRSRIVTGQQAGLFTGPSLTIYKALSAIRCADELTRLGLEAVPVFWIATQDHDLVEVSESFWNTRQGLADYKLAADSRYTGHSIGQVPLGEAISEILATAAQTLEGPAAAEITAALRDSYSPTDTFGSSFGKLLARLFAGRGLLLIDPQDAQLDALASPVYRAALEASDILSNALVERSRELEEAGYHAQVKVARESTVLFYNVEGRREPLRRTDDGAFTRAARPSPKPICLPRLRRRPKPSPAAPCCAR